MGRFPREDELETIKGELGRDRDLPENPAKEGVVSWHVFRQLDEALDFARHHLLDEGERVVGGRAKDSVGTLYWVGLHVDDLEHWGNRKAIHLTDGVDPQNPGSPML